jgi:hypothetical protein
MIGRVAHKHLITNKLIFDSKGKVFQLITGKYSLHCAKMKTGTRQYCAYMLSIRI